MAINYTFEEFSRHFRDSMSAAQQHAVSAQEWSEGYFPEHYIDFEEREYKRKRFFGSMAFVEKNIDQLNSPGLGVFDHESGALSNLAVLTLWGVFSHLDEDHLVRGVAWDEFWNALKYTRNKRG